MDVLLDGLNEECMKCGVHSQTERILALKFCYDLAQSLLPTEKQQIEDAWLAGSHDGGVLGASEYFSTTYNTNQ